MEDITLLEIIDAVKGKCSYNNNITIRNISTDSREIKNGDLYIALEGETFDGHDFVEAAIAKGALAVIVSKPIKLPTEIPIIFVKDTLQALWSLAAYYKNRLSKPIIAVTGSVGKTSTKDIIAKVLSTKYNVHKSKGNFNNHIGMPLTILGINNNHDITVLEMGMRGFGEIQALTNIAKPDIAVITNIGISHIERLGSKENILKAKLEIVEGLDKDGVLILNANDSYLRQINKDIVNQVIYVGIDIDADYTAYSIRDYGSKGVGFKVKINGKEYDAHIPAVGIHNVHNALIGIACGITVGMEPEDIIKGLSNYHSEKMRLNIIEKKGISFIDDCYNASPDSMRAGLQALKSIAINNRKIAVLGNMFELGDMAKDAHFEIGELCANLGIDFVAIMGENAKDLGEGIGDKTKYKIFGTHEEIIEYLYKLLNKGDFVLVKGSRGMKMEKIIEGFDK